MRTRIRDWFCLSALLLLTALPGRPETSIDYFNSITAEPAPTPGQSYYLRYCITYEKGTWATTAYTRGTFVPINTQVTLVTLGGKDMVLKLAGGETIKVDNVEKFTKRDMATIAHELLSAQPVPLEKFDDAMQKAIKSGTLKLGMTKEQVVMARGYPPRHKTPSLDGDTWVYWSSRFAEQTLVFENGVLARGRGIY